MTPIHPGDSVLWRDHVYLVLEVQEDTRCAKVRERGNPDAQFTFLPRAEFVPLTESEAVEWLMAAAKR